VKEAFFWLEVEVVKLGNFKNVMHSSLVISEVHSSGDTYIVHINADCHSQGFMFEDYVSIDKVHHGLKCRW